MTTPSTGNRTPRRTWRVWLMALAVFLSGLVVGSGATVFVLHQQRLRMFRNPEAIHQKLLADVKAEFNLNEAQVVAVAGVLQQRHQAFEQLRAEVHPRLEREFSLLESQIADVLPAERRTEWQDYFKKFRSTWMPLPPPTPTGT